MMEVKYTKDGKKVAIIGELNQNEYIVQEISVTESGDEIPAGDRFTAKGLLDVPVETWKVKEDRKLQNSIEKNKKELATLIDKVSELRSSMNVAHRAVRNQTLVFESEEFTRAVSHMFDIYSGKYLYKCRKGQFLEPPFDVSYFYVKNENYYGKRRHGSLRVMSVWIGDRSTDTKLYLGDDDYELFETLECAQEYVLSNLKHNIKHKHLANGTYTMALKLGFVPEHVIEEIKNKLISQCEVSPEEEAEKARLRQIDLNESNKKRLDDMFKKVNGDA